MSVPNHLNNSTSVRKYIIDAVDLNENFDSLSDGSGIDSNAIRPIHIANETFTFQKAITLGGYTDYPSTITPGSIFYLKKEGADGGFYGCIENADGSLSFIQL